MKRYTVEGWKGHAVVGWREVARPTTVIREAWHYAIDLGATITWVYRDGEAVGYFDGPMCWWRPTKGDEALEAAIRKEQGE